MDIFSNFYTNLTELFIKKPIDIPSKLESLRTINKSSTGIETSGIQTNNENSERVIERFRKIINKPEEIPIIEEIPVIEENTPFYENKYVIIGGILILSCLAWYFYDDLKPLGSSILAWFNSKRQKPDSDPNNTIINNEGSSKSKLQSLKDLVFNKFKKDDESNSNPDSIKSIDLVDKTVGDTDLDNKIIEDKGKTIDFNNLSLSEKERRGITNLKNVNLEKEDILKGLPPISGERDKFLDESVSILAEMKTLILTTEKGFPDKTLEKGLFGVTKERFQKLVYSNPDLLKELIKDKTVAKLTNDFFELDKKIFTETKLPEIKTEENILEVIKSPTYEEIAMATVEEQEVWSDKAMSPKVDNKDSENSSWGSSLKRAVKDIVEPQTPRDFPELSPMKQYEEPRVVSDAKLDDIENFLNKAKFSEVKENEDLQKVEFEWTESAEDYFKVNKPAGVKVQLVKDPVEEVNIETEKIFNPEKVKTSRMSLLEQINARRNEKDVLPSPVKPKPEELESNSLLEQNNSNDENIISNIASTSTSNVANVGLQTPIADRINPSPLSNKLGLSNMFENVTNLFDDNPIDIDIDTDDIKPGESSNQTVVKPDTPHLLQQIKSLRREYGTPIQKEVSLNEHNESPSETPPESSESSEEKYSVEPIIEIIDGLIDTKVTIDRNNHQLSFNFGNLKDKVKRIHTVTNDGYLASFGLKDNDIYPWDNRGNRQYSSGTRIKEIIIEDINGNNTIIYSNPDITSFKD